MSNNRSDNRGGRPYREPDRDLYADKESRKRKREERREREQRKRRRPQYEEIEDLLEDESLDNR